MRRSSLWHTVPVSRTRGWSRIFAHRRLWYIGSIYRTNKSQHFFTKFTRQYWTPHLKTIHQNSILYKYLFFRKFITQKCFFSGNFNIFGNIEKFEPRYYPHSSDGMFAMLPKNFLKNLHNLDKISRPLCSIGGAIFIPCFLDSGLDLLEIDLLNPYFYKGGLSFDQPPTFISPNYEHLDDMVSENLLLVKTIQLSLWCAVLFNINI